MAQKILIKKSTVAAKAPTDAQLDVGELAVNTADALLYTKHSDGSIKRLSPTLAERTKIADSVSSSDARLTNSREWTGATVSQAEAEGGIASTRRAWTAQRVRQAINAWWQLVTSGFGRNLVSASNEAAARNVLQLTYPATAPTVGEGAEVMLSGAYGWGATTDTPISMDANLSIVSGVYQGGTGAINFFPLFGALGTLIVTRRGSQIEQLNQLGGGILAIRHSIDAGVTWTQWIQMYHTNNLLNIGITPAGARGVLELTGAWVDLRPHLKPGFYYDVARNGRNSYPRIRKLSCGRVELDGVVSFNATSAALPVGTFVRVPSEFRPTLSTGGLMFGDTASPLSFGACNWIVTGEVEYSPPRVHGDIMVIPLTLTSPAQGGAISINGIYWFTN